MTLKILVVEDSPTHASERGFSLEAQGFEVVLAKNGVEALALVRQEKPDAILSDILIPEMDGFELCREVRNDPALRDIPFGLHTATYRAEDDHNFALDTGANLYLLKDSAPEDMAVILRKVIAGKHPVPQPERGVPGMDDRGFSEPHRQRMPNQLLEATTAPEQANDALRESSAFNVMLLQTIPFGMDLVDEAGQMLFLNPAMEKTLGKNALGKRCWELYKDDKGQCAGCPLKQDIEVGVTKTLETSGVLGGKIFQISHTGMFFRGQKVLVEVFHDITERKRAEEEVRRRAEQLGLLYDAGLALNQILDPHAQVEFLLKVSKQSLRADRAEFFEWDERSDQIGLQAASGFPQEIPDRLRDRRFFPKGEGSLVGWVAEHRTLLDLREVSLDPRYVAFDPAVRSGLWVPVQHEEKLLGIITMLSTRPNAFSPQDEQLLMLFANQIAVALENARLFIAEQARRKELAALYDLSRTLADTDDFNKVLSLTARHLVDSCQVTFVHALLVEGDEFVVQAGFPIRVLDRDLQTGRRETLAALPFCRRALERSNPIIARATDSGLTDLEREFLFDIAQSVCLIPLRVGENQLGLWVLGEAWEEEREPFTAEKLRLVDSISEQAAGALQRAKLREQTQRRLNQIQALHAIDMVIASSVDLRVILGVFLEHTLAQLHVDAGSILLLNPHTHTLDYAAGRGFHTRDIERSYLRLGEGEAGRAALEKRTMHTADLRTTGATYARAQLLVGEDFVSYYGVPLIAKGQVKGVLDIFHRAPLDPDAEWLDLMETLAGQAAIAIDNAGLFNDLQRSNVELILAYDSTIEGWSRAMDLRDKETEGHTQRVTEMAMRLARTFGISGDELVQVRRGALLHDIGKMGIPDNILLKAESLTDSEWEIMRRHPVYAFELLSPITYLRPALDIPYCHHEKWDGHGYPRGLKSEQIPLAARIFAIVDVWDALRSDRPYRSAWSDEKVREHIRTASGTHFDPQVVEVFLNIEKEGDPHERYSV